MSRVLVTGGAGFIASHVVDALIEAGHEVNVLDNLSTGKEENLNPKAKFFKGSVTKPSNIGLAIEGCEYVFHLAALARIQPSIEKPRASHMTNLHGTFNILEACRKINAKLIFSSSSSIYEGSKLPTREHDPIEPKNPYALHKWLSEQYIELYNRLYGLDYVILRYFNVFGERQIMEGAYAAVVGIFLNQRKQNQALTITGDGKQRRDFTYVKDVAKANLMAMDWNRNVYNIGTGHNHSILDLAEQIGRELTFLPERQGEVKITLADNSRAKECGWKPTVSIENWINDNL